MSALIHAIPTGAIADNVLLVRSLHISPGQAEVATLLIELSHCFYNVGIFTG